jgi:MerR family transcriptional regulator, thiopeptide resistance regulator
MNNALYRPREFANKAGITVRTLHHYDRIGLLKPAQVTSSGQRLYGQDELVRLERIVALKFIGLSLRSIGRLLEHDAADLATTLRRQRAAVGRMRQHLDDVLLAIERAESSAGAPGTSQWDALKTVIELMEMGDHMEWVKHYYTGEQLADLQSRATPELLARAEQDWKDLLADVEASLHEDPASEHARSLAARWEALLDQFTRGDGGIRHNLQRLYSDRANWPADFRKPYSDEAANFIARVRREKG